MFSGNSFLAVGKYWGAVVMGCFVINQWTYCIFGNCWLQAVLCTKVNAAKVQQAAYEVVLTVGKALIRWQPEDPGAAIKELVSQLTAGFTGGSYLVSCTILALSTALYEFKGTSACLWCSVQICYVLVQDVFKHTKSCNKTNC